MKTFRSSILLVLLLILLNEIVLAQPGSYYPPPSSINYQTDTLTIYPPDSLPGDPVILIGYNIYVDAEFYGNILISDPEGIIHYYLDDELLLPGSRIFCADAVYNEWISESSCDTALIIYGDPLPFFDDWSSGDFVEHKWINNTANWIIVSDEGNPAPTAVFQGFPAQSNYILSLESYAFNTQGMHAGNIYIDFNWKLLVNQPTGNEKLRVQVWNLTSTNWSYGYIYSNIYGNTDWLPAHIDITSNAMNTVFKIRFLAHGVNSQDIVGWYIDNIHIERRCTVPIDLVLEEDFEKNDLYWTDPDFCWDCWDGWYRWDDGENMGISFGFDDTTEFDVAVRWNALQLPDFDELSIFDISFFPVAEDAQYTVRVWSGENPDTLIAEQAVLNPKINEWNVVIFQNPVELDVNEDLWIGYHVSSTGGYPVGCDNGPAINGFGNMIYYQGEWKTLLEINPEMNYNWNIACHLYSLPYDEDLYFNIYRENNDGNFELYDISYRPQYQDAEITLADYYCYNVSKVKIKNGDTCESVTTDTVCEYQMLGTGHPEPENYIKVYPNPASEVINIESPDKISEVRIYNMLGECELKLEIGDSEGRVDVRRLGNGIYFVEVVTDIYNYKDKILVFR